MVSCDGHACVLIELLQTEEQCKYVFHVLPRFPNISSIIFIEEILSLFKKIQS